MQAKTSARLERLKKKKGRSQSKRPKSREETPKEGDGNARGTLPLPHCNNIHRDAQNASAIDLIPWHFPRKLLQNVQSSFPITHAARIAVRPSLESFLRQ
jgi:hypothetical protein